MSCANNYISCTRDLQRLAIQLAQRQEFLPFIYLKKNIYKDHPILTSFAMAMRSETCLLFSQAHSDLEKITFPLNFRYELPLDLGHKSADCKVISCGQASRVI